MVTRLPATRLFATETEQLTVPEAPPSLDTTPRARSWSWGYGHQDSKRDLRIDFLRGLAIVFVVVNHIHIPSLYHVISHERIGAVSGAELFVALSGLILGMVYGRRAVADGWWSAAGRMWSRARTLYLTSLVVLIATYLISLLPYPDATAVTTWTDQATGTVYSMYGTTPMLAHYPVPPAAVLDILFLNVGPFQFNVMGLYVVLLAQAPFALWLLLGGRWWLLLGISTGLYVLNDVLQVRLFPSQFENPFPFLSWQLIFFAGMTAGFHWRRLLSFFRSGAGRVAILISVIARLGFVFFAGNNPALESDPFSLRLTMIPEDQFWPIYEEYFRRDFLGPLRILNAVVLIITAYALLTVSWVPLNNVVGWLLVPLGGMTLYVFVMHVVFALIASNIPVLDNGTIWINTLAHTVILLTLWLMVKRQFLFRWIPR